MTRKAYEEVEVWLHSFFTPALVGGERLASRTGRSNP